MSYNMNRDYLIIADIKSGTVKSSPMSFHNTDRRISNIFAKLQITMSSDSDIKGFVSKEKAENYSVKMTVIKPKTNLIKEITGIIQDIKVEGNGAVYLFDLPTEFTDQIGSYICELEVKCMVNGQEEILTCDPFMYTVKASALTGLNDEIETDPDLPILKQLIEEVRELQENGGSGGGGHTAVIDNLTSTETKKALSANQGRVLKGLVDGKSSQGHVHSEYQTKTDSLLNTTSKNIVGAINEVNSKSSTGNVDLSEYQKKSDSSLNTNAKTVSGAINEHELKISSILTDSHNHDNKDTLDKITESKYNSWDSKSNANHSHTNLQPKTDDTLTTTSKEVVGAINENNTLIKTLNDSKYDNAILNGSVLELYANGVKKKSITLPTSSGEGGVNGQDGREVELQKSSTHIQWRYVGESSWTDLVALSELKGDDGLTTSITVNGTKYNHVNGNITLPDYFGGNGLTSVDLIVVDGNVTMTSDDIQNITLSEDVNIILPPSLVNKEVILNIICTTKDIIVTFKNTTENIKSKLAQDSYNVFTLNCNATDYIVDRKSTKYPTLSDEEIDNGITGEGLNLIDYQTRVDNDLSTTSKEVVGAINENTTQIENIVNQKLDGKSLKVLTQAEYDTITTKDENVIYIISDKEPSSGDGLGFKILSSEDSSIG